MKSSGRQTAAWVTESKGMGCCWPRHRTWDSQQRKPLFRRGNGSVLKMDSCPLRLPGEEGGSSWHSWSLVSCPWGEGSLAATAVGNLGSIRDLYPDFCPGLLPSTPLEFRNPTFPMVLTLAVSVFLIVPRPPCFFFLCVCVDAFLAFLLF